MESPAASMQMGGDGVRRGRRMPGKAHRKPAAERSGSELQNTLTYNNSRPWAALRRPLNDKIAALRMSSAANEVNCARMRKSLRLVPLNVNLRRAQ